MFQARLHPHRRIEAGLMARADSLTGSAAGASNRRSHLRSRAHAGTARRSPVSATSSFKAINDRYGHLVADDVLREVAGRLRESVRLQHRCSRWGGDEFAALSAIPTPRRRG